MIVKFNNITQCVIHITNGFIDIHYILFYFEYSSNSSLFFRIEGNLMQINQMENIKNAGLNMSANNKQLSGNIFL